MEAIITDNGDNKTIKRADLVITERRLLSLSGVEDVVNFDDASITMKTDLGTLSIDGNDLHILKLNLDGGEIAIEGTINGLYYLSEADTHPSKGEGRFRRFFR